MKRFLSIILIVVGIGFMSIPYLSNQLIRRNVNNSMDILEEISYEDIEVNQSREAAFDYSSVRDVDLTTVLGNRNEIDYDLLIGYISIDDLNINLPILKGVTDANLLVGVATMQENQEMGKGNYTLAGHYIRDKKTLFGPLLDIEAGSIVKITNKKVVYEYEIYNTEIVPDTAMYMLDEKRAEDKGKPIISLMTCYYTSKNGKRFFALGELVDSYPYDLAEIKSE
ncbi:MAG: class A sortase [Tissierellaceae bacterium]|nr:class A sortase [Tissierellaceae bacterium]